MKNTDTLQLSCKDVVYGSQMVSHKKFIYAAKFHPRDILPDIEAYGRSDNPRVGVLYGLRRTGKTVLLRQWLWNLPYEERVKAAYLTINGESLRTIKDDLTKLQEKGYKYVVIDEITTCEDFTKGVAALADNFTASGMRIFISGTDSLLLWLIASDELYDRQYTLHTTHIPFSEWKRLLGDMSLDAYMRYGGLLHLFPTEGEIAHSVPLPHTLHDIREHFTAAISNNLFHGLNHYNDGEYSSILSSLLFQNDMDAAVYGLFGSLTRQEFLNYMNGISNIEDTFLLSALHSLVLLDSHTYNEKKMSGKFKLPDIARTASAFINKDDRLYEIVSYLNKKLRTEAENMLHLQDAIGKYVSPAQFINIVEYLRHIEIFAMRPALAFPPVMATDEDYEMYAYLNNELHTQNLVSQPGLRYLQADIMRKMIEDDFKFQRLPSIDRKKIIDTFQNGVYGIMQEDIVLYETMQKCKLFGHMDVGDNSWLHYSGLPIKCYKASFPRTIYDHKDKEIDMIIEDNRNGTDFYLVEIKHSAKNDENQWKWLSDNDVLARLKRPDDSIKCKIVLYNGPSSKDEDAYIKYVNVEDYLDVLHKEGIEEAMDFLCRAGQDPNACNSTRPTM